MSTTNRGHFNSRRLHRWGSLCRTGGRIGDRPGQGGPASSCLACGCGTQSRRSRCTHTRTRDRRPRPVGDWVGRPAPCPISGGAHSRRRRGDRGCASGGGVGRDGIRSRVGTIGDHGSVEFWQCGRRDGGGLSARDGSLRRNGFRGATGGPRVERCVSSTRQSRPTHQLVAWPTTVAALGAAYSLDLRRSCPSRVRSPHSHLLEGDTPLLPVPHLADWVGVECVVDQVRGHESDGIVQRPRHGRRRREGRRTRH